MSERKSAIAAALSAVALATLLGSLQSVVWNGSDAPALAQAIAARIDPGLLRELASSAIVQPSESYFGYGRLTLIVYALLYFARTLVWRSLPNRARMLVAVSFAVAVVGDIAAYWASEIAGPGLRRVSFWYTELPALVGMVVLFSGVGVSRLRRRAPGSLLVVALPISLATTALLGYLPHGLLLGLSLTGVATGISTPARLPEQSPSARTASILAPAGKIVGFGIVGLILAAMYRPNLQTGPQPTLRPMIVEEVMEGARLHVFNTGYNRMSWLLVGRERPWRPVPAFVIEDPQSGLFVFDTGFSDAVAEHGEAGLHIPERWVIESRAGASLTLPVQMRKAGLRPEAVHHVAISHLHGDHVGQLDAFPNAQIIAGPGSTAFARQGDLVERWQEQSFESTIRFGPFDEAVDVTGDQSIVLIRGGGHASEGLMLLLALEQGPLLLAGDAVVHSDWLHSNDVQRIAVHPDRAAVVRNQVRSFLEQVPDSAVAYGHDLRRINCTRPDIICHHSERFRPEGQDSPDPLTGMVP